MNTLIELYDESAIENILAPDMFRPRRIVYLCPGEIAQDRTRQETLAAFFRRRGFVPVKGQEKILEKNIGYDPEFLGETAHTV